MSDKIKWDFPAPRTVFGDRQKACVGKLISKVPMQRQVVDKDGQLFQYAFHEGKTIFVRIATLMLER